MNKLMKESLFLTVLSSPIFARLSIGYTICNRQNHEFLVFRVLDRLDGYALLVSVRNVCQWLNDILNIYSLYQVRVSYLSKVLARGSS